MFHNVSISEAQSIVDQLVERRTPLIWIGEDMRRVLDPSISLREQILLFLSTAPGKISTADLQTWTGYRNDAYFRQLLRDMHEKRLIELAADGSTALILPPGDKVASELILKRNG